MAFEFVLTDLNAQYEVDPNDYVYMPRGIRQFSLANGFDARGTASNTINNVTLHLHGEIVAQSDAVNFYGDLAASNAITGLNVVVGSTGILTAGEHGMWFTSGSGVRVVNQGIVNGTEIGLRSTGGDLHVFNQGSIVGLTGPAIKVGEGLGDPAIPNIGPIQLYVNAGVIQTSSSTGDAMQIYGVRSHVVNSGQILGNIEFGLGDDRYEALGGGVASGTINGNGGDDTLVGGSAADKIEGGADADKLVGREGDDLLSGGSGDDLILAGAGNDELLGGLNNDTLNGNSGDDSLDGGDGNDVLVGQDGSDQILGGLGADTLNGGSGEDVLEGGDDNDVIRGGDGDDSLSGGEGLDFLTGGQGSDVFVFRNVSHAGIGATRDQVLDFDQGADIINVVSMSLGVFSFVGTGAFTATNQIRVIETANGSSIVQFNTNADLTPEAELRVGGVIGLTADDFAL